MNNPENYREDWTEEDHYDFQLRMGEEVALEEEYEKKELQYESKEKYEKYHEFLDENYDYR